MNVPLTFFIIFYHGQLGSDHVNVATFYNNLGNVHSHLGDLQQAKRERALDIRIKQLGSDHVCVLTSYDYLRISP